MSDVLQRRCVSVRWDLGDLGFNCIAVFTRVVGQQRLRIA